MTRLAFYNPSYPVWHCRWKWGWWSKLTNDSAGNLVLFVKWQAFTKRQESDFKIINSFYPVTFLKNLPTTSTVHNDWVLNLRTHKHLNFSVRVREKAAQPWGHVSERPAPTPCPHPRSTGCDCCARVSTVCGGGGFCPRPTLTFCWIWVLAWQFLLSFPLALWES